MFISLSSWPFLVSPVLILTPSNTMIDLSEEYQIIKLIYVKNVEESDTVCNKMSLTNSQYETLCSGKWLDDTFINLG